MGMSDFIGSYQKEGLIGHGSFGNVFEVTKRKRTYALKRIVNIDDSALQEAKILKQIHHDYIVSHYENFTYKDYLCIVMEYADKGTLTNFVIFNWGEEGVLGYEYNVWRVIDNLSDALRYLHSFRPTPMIHCDIKPDNILVFSGYGNIEDGEKTVLKLADFGVAKLLNQEEQKPFYTSSKTQCGAAIYMAPEVLKSESFTFSADMWSLGALISFYCNKGDHLFPHATDVLEWQEHGKRVLPHRYSMSLRNVVMDLLNIYPRSRPTASKVNLKCTNKRTERGMHNDSHTQDIV